MAAFMTHALNLSHDRSSSSHNPHELTEIDPDRLVITSGVTAAVGLLAHVLADAGDSFIVPTPFYPGFTVDLERQAGVTIIPAATYSNTGFDISTSSLEAALRESQWEGGDEEPRMEGRGWEEDERAEGRKERGGRKARGGSKERRRAQVRGVLLSSPSNPLGRTFSDATLLRVLQFCRTWVFLGFVLVLATPSTPPSNQLSPNSPASAPHLATLKHSLHLY
ncbi:unnamed protein product [Closterium sp. Naga37s-1]|nr:unnamed protein product [Closterium sp. Naga37s-1]